MILKKLSQLLKKCGLIALVYRDRPYSSQFQPDVVVSSKIRFGQAMHLERRERIEEAIELLKQAAEFFPPSGFGYLGRAAELAERNPCIRKLAYYGSNLYARLLSFT